MSVMNRPYSMDRLSQSAYLNLSPSYKVLCPLFMPLGVILDYNYISTNQ
jgi:hypothetical protein